MKQVEWPSAALLGTAACAICVWIFLRPYVLLAPKVLHTPVELQAGLVAWGMLVNDPRLITPFSPSLRVFGRDIAVMWLINRPINGPAGIYTLLPFIAFSGPTEAAITMRNGLFSVLSIVLTYALGLELHRGRRFAAFLGALLFAASPGFVTESLFGLARGVSVVAASLACVLLLLLYDRTHRNLFAYSVFFVAGLALCDQPWSLGLIAGLLACGWMFARRGHAPAWRSLIFCIKALAAFLVPLTPMLAFNLQNRAETLRFLARHLLISENGTNNLDFGNHLLLRFSDLIGLLNGATSWLGLIVARPERFVIASQWPYGAAAAILAGFALPRARKNEIPKRWLAAGIIAAVYFALSAFTPGDYASCHLLPLVPLFTLALGALCYLPRSTAARRVLATALTGLAVYTVVAGDRAAKRLAAELDRSGAVYPGFALATRDLANWALTQERGDWLIFFPQLHASLAYCSRGTVPFRDGYYLVSSGALRNKSDSWFLDRSRFFVFVPRFQSEMASEIRDPFPAFREELSRRRLVPIKIRAFQRPDGTAAYVVYRVLPANRSPATPARNARRP